MAVITLGGCIRLYPTGPEWHVDTDHHTVGIDPTIDPTIDDSGFLNFWTLVKNPVVSATAAADETLVGRGIHAGISNGTHLVRIRLYKVGVGALDLSNPTHYGYAAGPYSNLWVTLVHNESAPPA